MEPQSIRSKILRSEAIDWRKLQFIQQDDFKELPLDARAKLKASLLANNFVEPFYVWEAGYGTLYCLDGRHRSILLQELSDEGHTIPEYLPAVFVDCENRQEAAKLVLIFSSTYAKVTESGLLDFVKLQDLDMSELSGMIDLPSFEALALPSLDESLSDGAGSIAPPTPLSDRFLVPPFSVLDTRQRYWQERKRQWHALIGDDGASRNSTLRRSSSGDDPSYYRQKREIETKLNRKLTTEEFERDHYERGTAMPVGVSLLDPVLSELVVLWFGIPGGSAFDPFAGDTVFGFVAASKGQSFTGIELREEQAAINQQRLNAANLPARYICDDGQHVATHLAPESQDLLFSCPPYFDLEVYSDDPADASNQDSYADYLAIIRNALTAAVTCLKENRFAVIVIGDVRNKKTGAYLGLPQDIVAIMKAAGMIHYNECILIEMIGNAPIRAAAQMKYRKVVKTHQQVLVFYKGDPRQVQNHFPQIVYESRDMEALDMGADDGTE